MICIVGDILTDVTLSTTPFKMRLGGIAHAARGLWALGVDYAIAYFAPTYLDGEIEHYFNQIGCKRIHKIGNVTGSPYTMLIKEVKEVGDQGYEFLYRDCVKIEYFDEEANHLQEYDELFAISGNYNFNFVLDHCRQNQPIHTDVANNVERVEQLPSKKCFKTLFVSTSSDLFKNNFTTVEAFFEQFKPYTERVVLKENRGGSRAYDFNARELYNVPSQTSTIVHSVGVGDVYDVTAITATDRCFEDSLYLASWVSMHYAKSTFVDNIHSSVQGVLKISADKLKSFSGCLLPWEKRQNCNIYVAAPDFDFVETTPIDILCNSLAYHNFAPHRPVKENGQMTVNAPKNERQRLFHGDMHLLDQCNMLIAVLLYNDPGTLIEIGLAAQRGIPTLVYDPNKIADNCMLTELPTLVSNDLDEIIAKVFTEYSKQYQNGTL